MTERYGFQVDIVNGGIEPERRKKIRVQGPISANVRGNDLDGGDFEIEAMLDNLSAGGLYVRLHRPVAESAELSFVIRLPPGAGAGDPGMRVAASGVVRRVEPSFGDTCGMGVEFTRYRVL